MKNIYLKWAMFALFTFCYATFTAHADVGALLGECMREYQVRYRALNSGSEYVWPPVFDCRESGTPAPPNPSDTYYSQEVEDPERAAELAEALLNIVTQPGFLSRFVSNYDELKAGNALEVESYNASKLGLVAGGSVAPGDSLTTLINIRRAIHRLVYIHQQTYQDNVVMRNGVGYQKYGWYLALVRDRALNTGDPNDPTWDETKGWDYQIFEPNNFYESNDILHDGYAYFPYNYEYLGFYEHQAVNDQVWIYPGTSSQIQPVSRAELRIIKGEIGSWKLSGTSSKDEVELFLKLDDLGVSNNPIFLGDSRMRNPPVANIQDNRFAFYSRKTGAQEWIWPINEQYDNSYKPSFHYLDDFFPNNFSVYENGWLITDSVAIIKPDLTPIIDSDISCGCVPCGGTNCPPGTPSYANSSIAVTFPLGEGTNGKSAGYLMLHKSDPTTDLENSSSLEFFAGEGSYEEENNEAGVSRTFVAPTVHVHAVDNPDGNASTKDWKLEFYTHYPDAYEEGDVPYHEVRFEAIYATDTFDRFEITETGSLGNRRRDYVWKSETVEGDAAHVSALVENGQIIDFIIEDAGSRFFAPPEITLTDATGSGAVLETETAVGVVTSVEILDGGEGFTEAPVVEIVEPASNTAQFAVEVLDGSFLSVNVASKGTGYSGDEMIIVTDPGGGTGAVLEPIWDYIFQYPALKIVLDGVEVLEAGSGYSEQTTLVLQSSSGSGAQLVPVLADGQISGIQLIEGGSGFMGDAALQIIGDGSGAIARPVLENGVVVGVNLISGGSGYDATTQVSLVDVQEESKEAASAVAVIENGSVVSVEILSGGTGYSDRAEVRFSDGGGTGAIANVKVADHVISKITVVDGGSGYGPSPEVVVAPPPADVRAGWELIYYDTDGTTPLKYEYNREGIGNDGNPAKIVTIRNGDGIALSEVTTTYFEKSYGRQPASMVETILDPNGNATGEIQTNYSYFENQKDASYGLLAEKWRSHNGPWEKRTYDGSGRLNGIVRQHQSSRIDDPDTSSAVTIFEYNNEDLDGDSSDEVVTVRTEYLLGEIVQKSSEIWWSGSESGNLIEFTGQYEYREKWDVQYLDPSDPSDKLVTKNRYYAGGCHDGKLRSVETPDGRIRIYEYAANGLETVTFEGAKEENEEDIAKGTKNYRLVNAFGGPIVETTWAYPGYLLLTEFQTTDEDAFGRPLESNLLYASGGAGTDADTVYASISRVYGCCGLESETDENGITTSYLYDGLKRQYQTTRGGVIRALKFDALGRIREETVNEVLQRRVDYDSTGMIVSEESLFQNTLVETTRSYERSRDDFNVETVTFPEGSQSVKEYYKDGSLYRQTGDAVLPMRYEHSSEAGEIHTTMRRLKLTEGGYVETEEFERSVTDMVGRLIRTERPHPSGTGIAVTTSGYNARGQLAWTEDADAVRKVFTYNEYSEPSGSYVDDPITGLSETVTSNPVYSAERARIVIETTSLRGNGTSELRTEEQTPDGLQSWSTQFGLESHTVIERDGATFSRRETTVLPDGTSVVATFDLNGRLGRTEQLDIHGTAISWTQYSYDSDGRLWKSTDGRNGTTTYTYYDDGQVLSVVTPDPDSSQNGVGFDAQTTFYAYAFEPGGGVRTTVTLPDQSTQVSIRDSLGRIIRNYGSGITASGISYDYAGRQSTLTTWSDFDALTGTGTGAAVTQWLYNEAGLLEEKRFDVQEGSFEPGPGYTYTAAGRLRVRSLARGVNTRYLYNEAGLLWKTDQNDDGTFETETTYDAAGRPISVDDESGTRTLAYDFGQLASETYSSGLLEGIQIDRVFDGIGRYAGYGLLLDSVNLHSVTHDYDSDNGRLQRVTSGSQAFEYSYQTLSNHIGEIVFRNGEAEVLVQTRGIDFLGRLKSMVTEDSDENPISSYAYRYDDLNRRTHSTLVNGSYWQYQYDAMGQVTGTWKKRADDSQIPGWAYGYAFDSIGNRTEATSNGATTAYEADSLNQYDNLTVPRVVDLFGEAPLNLSMTANGTPLARDGETFYGQLDFTGEKPANRPHRAVYSVAGTLAGAGDAGRDAVREERGARYFPPAPYEPVYDADGNLLDDGRWAYTWNADNRLVEIETHRLAVAAGVRREKLEFRYDSQGRRFEKRRYHWNPQSEGWESVAHRLYAYDGWNLIAEFDAVSSDLSLETTYTWGLDLSGTWQGAGGVGGLLCVYDAATGETSAPYFDGNGNVMGYADTTSGAIVAEYEYGPFGESVIAKGARAGEFTFRFSTKFTDTETGLLYYGYRYYDPDAGRWLSRDPLGEEGGINLYGFVGNDGVNRWDYLGMCWSNATAVAHYLTNGGDVSLATTGCVSTVTNNVGIGTFDDRWAQVHDIAIAEAANHKCPNSSSWTKSGSFGGGVNSGVFWIGGFYLETEYECEFTPDCGNCEVSYKCKIENKMDDTFEEPLNFNGQLQVNIPLPGIGGGSVDPINISWPDPTFEVGFTFSVAHTWTDEASNTVRINP